MTLRRLEITDAERCVVLAGDRLGLTAGQYAEEFERADRRWLGVEIDGDLVAFAGCWDAPDDCHLLAVAVAPGQRRHGVGRALLEQLIEDTDARGAGPMTLEVRADNTAAIGLYHGCGFVEVGRRPSYYGDADALIMTRLPAVSPTGSGEGGRLGVRDAATTGNGAKSRASSRPPAHSASRSGPNDGAA